MRLNLIVELRSGESGQDVAEIIERGLTSEDLTVFPPPLAPGSKGTLTDRAGSVVGRWAVVS